MFLHQQPVYSLNAFIIDAMLSYVPVTKMNIPNRMMTEFLTSMKSVMPVDFCDDRTSSMTGGKTSASAVLLTAPTSEMKRPSCGIDSARITGKKVLKINRRQLVYTRRNQTKRPKLDPLICVGDEYVYNEIATN